MATAQAVEGIAGPFWFHFDLEQDVLYVRLLAERETQTWGEEDDSGIISLRTVDGDRPVGLTVVNWWKRFGVGSRPDSVSQIAAGVDPWIERARAAA